MKTFYLLIVSFLFFINEDVNAQISTNELPPSFSEVILNKSSVPIIDLEAPNVAEALHEDSLFADAGIPFRVSLPINVNISTDNAGLWQNNYNGYRIWRVQIHAVDARSLTLGYDRFWLPDGGRLFIYNSDKTFCIGAFTAKNNVGTKEHPAIFATGFVWGDDIIIEYYEPEGSDSGIISIDNVGYVYRNVLGQNTNIKYSLFGQSKSCNVNINCQEGADWQKEKRAVACIYNQVTGGLCSGALMNSVSQEDYFLTADHCFSGSGYDAQGNNQLGRLIFYWNYESDDCTNTRTSNAPSSCGATLVANNNYSDFALLKLTEKVKNVTGYVPYYLGWTLSPNPADRGIGIHHPKGDVKKISIDNDALTSYASSQNWVDGNGNIISTTEPNTHWKTVIDIGTTEGGSSGSPLFNQNHQVIGQLHGGSDGCAPIAKYYGRLDKSWNYGTAASRRLKDWLYPSDGLDKMEARDFCTITGKTYFSDSAVYMVNGLPAGYIVRWRCAGKAAPAPFLVQNQPKENQCILRNKYNYPFVGPLTAFIVYKSDTVAIIKKAVTNIPNFLLGTYRQENCIYNGVNHSAINGNISGAPIYVNQGCTTYVKLSYTTGLIIEYEDDKNKIKPIFSHYDESSRVFSFQLPSGSAGIPYYFSVKEPNSGDRVARLTFFSRSNSAKASLYSIKVTNNNDSEKCISLENSILANTNKILNWNVEIYNVSYGTKVFNSKQFGTNECIVNTVGWQSGIYIIHVDMDGEAFVGKMEVNK